MNELRKSDGDQIDWSTKAGLAVFIVFTCVFAACGRESINPFTSTPDKGVTVENILSNPSGYPGKEVTVVAAVSKTLGETAFLLHGENLAGELLVVGADVHPGQPNDSIEQGLMLAKSVRVTGVVRHFDLAAAELETGVRLDDQRLQDYRGRPVIIAKSVQTVDP